MIATIDSYIWHNADIAIADRLHQLQRHIGVTPKGIDTSTIGIGFGFTRNSDRFSFTTRLFDFGIGL